MYTNRENLDFRFTDASFKPVGSTVEPYQQQQQQQRQFEEVSCKSLRLRQRQDSFFQFFSSMVPEISSPQEGAEAQPHSTKKSTPLGLTPYSQRAGKMSRDSLTYFSQCQYHDIQQHHSPDELFKKAASPSASGGSRSGSHYTVASTTQQTILPPQTLVRPSLENPTQEIIATSQSSPSPCFGCEPVFSLDMNDVSRRSLVDGWDEREQSNYITTLNEINNAKSTSHAHHPRSNNFTFKRLSYDQKPSTSYIYTVSTPDVLSGSESYIFQPISCQTTKINRRSQSPLSSPIDPVIGEVTRSGKFKCYDPSCNDLSFGRQADFKRHYDNVHAIKRIEYFCPQNGCERSKTPSGKSKGRSFKGRKDKMEEHVRTVHQKETGKKRRPGSHKNRQFDMSESDREATKEKRQKTEHLEK